MQRKNLVLVVAILAFALVLSACGSDKPAEKVTEGTYQTLSVSEAHERLQDDSNAVFVDVRTAEEYATGHAEGTVLIPLDELESRAAAELPQDKNIYVICRSGNRSQTASEALVSLGYEHVYNIDGGTNAWSAQNLPMSTQ